MIISLIISVLFTLLLMPLYIYLIKQINSVDFNFENKLIPISFGGFIISTEFLLTYIIYQEIVDYWYALVIIVIIGTIDDIYGNKEIKGLYGHLKAFKYGKITSGLHKAIIGGIISLHLSYMISDSYHNMMVNFILILLMINTINLFDLRPGRSIKVFFVFYLLLGTRGFFEQEISRMIILGVLLIVFFFDVRAKIMIGDSGANLLGLQLGIWYSVYFSLMEKWIIVIALILLHIYSEKKSITKYIDGNILLQKIDMLGRK